MTSLSKRLDALERRWQPPGKFFVVYGPDGHDLTEADLAEFERRKEAVEAEMGPDDCLFVVVYGDYSERLQ